MTTDLVVDGDVEDVLRGALPVEESAVLGDGEVAGDGVEGEGAVRVALGDHVEEGAVEAEVAVGGYDLKE